MRRLTLALALLGAPAEAQTPRPQCGYGEALSALAQVEREASRRPEGLAEGRARAEAMLDRLAAAEATLRGCLCPDAAERAQEASRALAPAPAEASAARIAALFEQARTRALLAREQLSRRGCR